MSPGRNWTTPEELRSQLEKIWRRGEFLAAQVTGDSPFPLRLRLRGPTGGEVAERFDAVRAWIRSLREDSRERRGYGYELEWQEMRNRVHGSNRLPVAACFPETEDALRLIGRIRDAERFDRLIEASRDHFPQLLGWLARHPLTALQHAREWQRLLAVLSWFRDHPRPGLYLRQLDITGVDTKFIEHRRRLLGELLDLTLPAHTIDHRHTGARAFEARYGLRQRPIRIRFRLLDPGLTLHGLSDLTVPVEEFANLDLDRRAPGIKDVFITENEINGIAFPSRPGSAVILGLGYALDLLGEVPWLHRVHIHYWGDIDTHGFAILARLRNHLPHTRSLLMDRETLEQHQALWVEEPAHQRFIGVLNHLTASEQSLFEFIRDNALGCNIRLEQERIGYRWLEQALAQLECADRVGLQQG